MKTIFKTYGMLNNKELKEYEEWAIESEQEYNSDKNYKPDEDTIYRCIQEDIQIGFEDDFNYNLNKILDNDILCIASIGKWNGRFQGYKICKNNLNEILSGISCDEFHIYFDGYNIKGEGYHHDGKNYVEYREIRPDRSIDNLLNMIYSGEKINRNIINYYTKSLGHYIKEIYGW